MKSYKIALLALAMMVASTAHTSPIKHDGVVAIVNNQIILKSELDNATLALASQNKNLSPDALKKDALEMLIVRKLQLGIVERAGIIPNESVINRQLLDIAKAQGFNTLADFQKSLDNKKQGSYASLRASIIEQASIATLWQAQLGNRVKVTKQEIDAFLASPEGQALSTEEYSTLHIRVPFIDDVSRLSESERNIAIATAHRLRVALKTGLDHESAMKQARGNYPQELQGAYTGHNRITGLPREIATLISSLKVGEISEPIVTETGVDVIQLIDKRNSQAVIVPEWHTSHILVKVDTTQPDAIAEQKINEIYTALRQGADFKALASTYSEDLGSASQEGSLDWVGEGVMVPEFETMMKKTIKGDYSAPFKSQFGYHILKVNDTRQRDVTEEYKRAQAEEILFNRLAPQAGEDWVEELKASSYIKIMAE